MSDSCTDQRHQLMQEVGCRSLHAGYSILRRIKEYNSNRRNKVQVKGQINEAQIDLSRVNE